MRSIVPLRLFVRMISSGVDFILFATFCRTSPDLTMYSSFSGEGWSRKQNLDVHFAEKILGFLGVLPSRDIFE